ncbi:MAG: M42 family peptidase [Clostridia bacterium]|nr:M42 family peptidase [Clostridia bacterium]
MEFDRAAVEKDFRERIKTLSSTFGPSGFEEEVVEEVRKELSATDFELSDDLMLNLIAHKKGRKPGKLLVAAHTDEIGLIVRHIDRKGFLWFETLGGIAPQQFFGKHVIVRTEEGKHIDGIVNYVKPGRPQRAPELPKDVHGFFIEVGAESYEEVREMGIEEGAPVSIDYPVINLGRHRLGGKALDDRALVFILEEVVKLFDGRDDIPDFYAAFTSQEEVGARGAIVAAQKIQPDVVVALDMSLATDIPHVPESEYVNELGKGTSIKIMDKLGAGVQGLIANRQVVKDMKSAAKKHDIPYQIEAYAAGATDASFVQTLNHGTRAGGIQIPMRYVHSYEVVDVRDVVDTVELLYRYIEQLTIE